jgi:small subunit ribosomal protein S20
VRKNKSAIKRSRQAEGRRLRNSHVKSTMKTTVKRAVSAVNEGGQENLEGLFRAAVKQIGRAASKGVIHKRTAARKVSRLSRKVQGAKAQG